MIPGYPLYYTAIIFQNHWLGDSVLSIAIDNLYVYIQLYSFFFNLTLNVYYSLDLFINLELFLLSCEMLFQTNLVIHTS